MNAKDPKQAVIQTITNPNPFKEERGMFATPENIHFLKEKDLQYIYACTVNYTNLTG